MSATMCLVTNRERRPVTFRGNSGESFHLAPLESGREIRALEVDGNALVEKLKRRNVLSVETPAARAKKSKKKASSKKASSKKTASKKTAKRGGKRRTAKKAKKSSARKGGGKKAGAK